MAAFHSSELLNGRLALQELSERSFYASSTPYRVWIDFEVHDAGQQ